MQTVNPTQRNDSVRQRSDEATTKPTRPLKLEVEILEQRIAPARFGLPWQPPRAEDCCS